MNNIIFAKARHDTSDPQFPQQSNAIFSEVVIKTYLSLFATELFDGSFIEESSNDPNVLLFTSYKKIKLISCEINADKLLSQESIS